MPRDHHISTPTIHILLALSEGEKHGYHIIQDVLKSTEGKVRLGAGTLYGCLKRLLEDGWIREVERKETEDPRRRYYQIEATGRAALQEELRNMQRLVSSAIATGMLEAL